MLEAAGLRRWVKTLEGCLRFLNELKQLKPDKREGWAKGNYAHYLKRAKGLCDNVPVGGEKLAAKARVVLAELEKGV